MQGSVRRKKKITNKEHLSDDKKIQAIMKKAGLTEIPNIDEVRLFSSLSCSHSSLSILSKFKFKVIN